MTERKRSKAACLLPALAGGCLLVLLLSAGVVLVFAGYLALAPAPAQGPAEVPGELLAPPEAVAAAEPPRPAYAPDALAPGEKLTYELVWNHIPVGRFTVEVLDRATVRGIPCMHFKMAARTNDVADKIYPVRTTIHSYAATDLSRSMRYLKNQNEGDRSRIVALEFLWDRDRVRYVKDGDLRGLYDVQPGAVDPLTLFYVLRCRELKVGVAEELVVSDGRHCVASSAEVLRREQIEIGGEQRDAFVLAPNVDDMRGVFAKSEDAHLYIWVSADEDRVPLRIESKVIVGSFYGSLVDHVRPDETGGE